jgi:hypothetical protein
MTASAPFTTMFSRAKFLGPIFLLSATSALAAPSSLVAPAPLQPQVKELPAVQKELENKKEQIKEAEKEVQKRMDREAKEILEKKAILKELENDKKVARKKAQQQDEARAKGLPVVKSLDPAKPRGKKQQAGSRPKVGSAPAARQVGGGKGVIQSKASPEQLKKESIQRKKQAALVQADPGAKLNIEFGTERHDFGKVRQGDQVEHSFVMQAAGTTPLKIRQVKPSCGCTVGSVQVADAEGAFQEYTYGDPIEPGRTIQVKAAVSTTNKKNKAQVRVQIMSNDPAGTHSLTLAAEVQPFLVVTPPMMNFGDIPMGGQRDQRVDIRTSRGEAVLMHVDPARLGTMPQGVNVSLTAMNPDENGKSAHWKVDVHIGADAKEGQANSSLRILTDIELPIEANKREKLASTGQPIIPQFFSANLSVQARILGSFSLDRPYLSFGLVRPGQITPRVARLTCNEQGFTLGEGMTVEIRGQNGAAFEFSDLFETSIRPVAGVSAVDIELLLKGFPDGVDKSFSGEMVIRTGHPGSPEKVVRFSGVCRSGVNPR